MRTPRWNWCRAKPGRGMDPHALVLCLSGGGVGMAEGLSRALDVSERDECALKFCVILFVAWERLP